MNKNQITIIIVSIVFLLLIVGGGIYYKMWSSKIEMIKDESGKELIKELKDENKEELEAKKFTSEVPKSAVETKPVSQAPAAPGSSAKLGFYEIEISRAGFSPSTIVVKKGNLVQIKVKAIDGNYDLLIPYAEMWVDVGQGETKQISFQADAQGTFIFECKNKCPITGKVQGTLIILPE